MVSGLSGHIWHMTSALALSASEHADVRPVSYDVRHTRRAAVRAYPMTILRYATSSRADGRSQSGGRIRIGIATEGSFGSGPEVDRLVAILGVRISPRPTPKQLWLVSADGRLVPGNIRSVAYLGDSVVRGSVSCADVKS